MAKKSPFRWIGSASFPIMIALFVLLKLTGNTTVPWWNLLAVIAAVVAVSLLAFLVFLVKYKPWRKRHRSPDGWKGRRRGSKKRR